jgi:hypothetical protein
MPYDPAVHAITNAPHLSFQWLRGQFGSDNGLKDSLRFGHAVIDEVGKLDQYLYTYGPMIESQWASVAPMFSGLSFPTRWIDYGCGQGLAGLLLRDRLAQDPLEYVTEIVLIEPSTGALARADAVYRRLAPEASITAIAKRFDDVTDRDVPLGATDATLHLFSNSLDVTGFDPLALISRSLHPGRHTIVAVSHDRDFNGGTPRIEAAKTAFENPALAPDIRVSRSELRRFVCNNPSASKGVVWICELEVADG